MTDTVNLLVEYGGLDAKAKETQGVYTNDYLPKRRFLNERLHDVSDVMRSILLRHAPLQRGIQYSVLPVCFHNARTEYWIARSSRAMTRERYGWPESESPLMNRRPKTSGVHQSAAHLRVVSDRRCRRHGPGIQLAGVSKTYRRATATCRRCTAGFHINAGEFFVVADRPAAASPRCSKMISAAAAFDGPRFCRRRGGDKAAGNVGIVFQVIRCCLPWRNILGNVMLPIDMKPLPRHGISCLRAMALLKLVGLEGFEKKLPWHCPAACSSGPRSAGRLVA